MKVLDQVHLVSMVGQKDLVDPHVMVLVLGLVVLESTPPTVGRARLPEHWQNACEVSLSGKGGFPVQEEEEEEEEGQY